MPVYVHGDEGVTFRKQGVLVAGIQSPFGRGGNNATVLQENEAPTNLTVVGIPLNFMQTALQTRLLCLLAPRDPRC